MDDEHALWYNGDGARPLGVAAPVRQLLDKFTSGREKH